MFQVTMAMKRGIDGCGSGYRPVEMR